MTDLELYCYDIGEWVKIIRTGINYDRVAVVVNRSHLSNPIPTNMYTVTLIEDPDIEITTVPEASMAKGSSTNELDVIVDLLGVPSDLLTHLNF